jgi:hypothetical protein
MILLIPTNDGFSLAPDFDKANAVRYMTIINGYVKEDELREIDTNVFEDFLSTLGNNENVLSQSVNESALSKDRNKGEEKIGTVITAVISNEMKKIICNHNFNIILTPEHNIINVVMDYLKYYDKKESDYCCMP